MAVDPSTNPFILGSAEKDVYDNITPTLSIVEDDTALGNEIHFFAGTGSPAGVVEALAAGDVYFEKSNPAGMWLASAAGTGGWVQGAGGGGSGPTVYSSYATEDGGASAEGFTGIASITVPAGTYIVDAQALVQANSSTGGIADLFVSSEAANSYNDILLEQQAPYQGNGDAASAGYALITLSGVVTVTESTTLYLGLVSTEAIAYKHQAQRYDENFGAQVSNASGIRAVSVSLPA